MQARLAHPVYAVGCARKAALSLRPVCAGAIFLVPHNFTGKIHVESKPGKPSGTPRAAYFGSLVPIWVLIVWGFVQHESIMRSPSMRGDTLLDEMDGDGRRRRRRSTSDVAASWRSATSGSSSTRDGLRRTLSGIPAADDEDDVGETLV